ncbi:hypothetical protein PUMCH_000032 [Australozyma saopauloensis]|uniref:Glycoside hydrolase family 5 domain-containing protein n=1 Tax=Australozyma saopauloensis TaxID=291208 RepID=A0AAX4H2P9_9ASCO|nr:hypothetical protein PUMCH_000032 [[Candida] saopauloensis]
MTDQISSFPSADDAVTLPITSRQIFRARQNLGVNLGGVFVREKWIFHLTFPGNTLFELEAVAKSVNDVGVDQTRRAMEKYWKDYISNDDWKWMQGQGVTGVRIPLGYWNIGGGKFVSGTKFESFSEIYRNSWNILKSHYIEPAAGHNIAICVDIHALPGGANGDASSGEKNGGSADFWSNQQYQDLMVQAMRFVAQDLLSYDNISSILLANEAVSMGSIDPETNYYVRAIKAIREIDTSIPIVISDAWSANQYVKWVQQQQGENNCAGLIIDEHCYRCFSQSDLAKSADQITNDLQSDLLSGLDNNGRGVDIMIGEWTCVLDGQTWARTGLDPNDYGSSRRAAYVAKFAQTQMGLFLQRAPASIYFWTYKFESGNGGEWDFKQQLNKSFTFPSVSVPTAGYFDVLFNQHYQAHVDYWHKANPNENYEHYRYEDGFKAAWNDYETFAKAGSRVGRTQAIKSARYRQHLKSRGVLRFLWEWDHGYNQALSEVTKYI